MSFLAQSTLGVDISTAIGRNPLTVSGTTPVMAAIAAMGGYLEMQLKPLVCLDLSNFVTCAESLGWQGFQVTFQISSKARGARSMMLQLPP